jgi:hypothetical protein
MKRLHLFGILFGMTLRLFAESGGRDIRGTIEGTIVDRSTLQPLAAANVVLMGTLQGAACDPAGKFLIRDVPPGIYRLKASLMGYEDAFRAEVSVLAGRASMVRFELNPTVLRSRESVRITPGYFRHDPERITSLKSLTPGEIRRSAGSGEDIFRIIQSMPGVGKSGSMSAGLIVRGGAPDENLTLLDNVEIVNPLHFGRQGMAMGVISIINPSLLEGVDFLTGGFPVRYGDKLSSVFEMRLKEGNRTHMNTDVNINLAGLNLTLDGPVSQNGNVILSVRRGVFDLLTSLMNAPVSPRYWDAVGKWTTHMGPNHTVSVVGFYYRDDVERTGTAPHGDVDELNKYNLAKRADFGTAIGVNWRYLFSRKGYLLTTAALTGNGWNFSAGSGDKPNRRGDDILENEFVLKSEFVYKPSAPVEMKFGVFGKAIRSDHRLWREADTTRTGFVFPAASTRFDPPLCGKTGSFAQMGWRPFPRFVILSGLRLDHFDFTDEWKLSPRAGLSVDLSSRTEFHASYGVFHQTPAAYQAALDPANEDLRSGRAVHAVAGVDVRMRDDTQCSVEIYHKTYQNAFVDSDTSRAITNAGSGFARGVELFVQKKMSDRLTGSLAYTYSVSRRRDAGFLPDHDSDYDQRHNLTWLAGFQPDDRWQVGVKFQMATGFPYTPSAGTIRKNDRWVIREGEHNSARYPDFYKLDIRIDRTFRLTGWTLSAYVDLWNVTNRKNVVSYRYRSTGSGVEKEAIKDFPFMPIVGASIQF